MAESRRGTGGGDGQSGCSMPGEDGTDREQRDRDDDQDVKDRELFEALQSERDMLAALYSELEQERNCSATAASEALAMISRLQEEKAAVQLEARQFQRMVLEKARYDEEAIEALNELLASREEEKVALEEEIRVCREKLDSVVREERRQSSSSKEKGSIALHSPILTESPILIQEEKIITTPGAGPDEQSKYVDKFSTSKSQVLTALVQDGQLGLGGKFGKSDDDEKPEFPAFVSLRRRWGSQEVSLKTLEQSKEERQIEERRIEERRLSVLEYVMRFEQQQQQGVRLPVKMQSVTRLPKSGEEPRSETRIVDIDESSSSITSRKDESDSRVLTRDDSLRRRLFVEEEDCDEEHNWKTFSSEDAVVEVGGGCEERSCGVNENGNEVIDSKVCSSTDTAADQSVEKVLFVHDVYEVQKSPYEVPAPVMGDAEMQPATPSDRLGKPDMQTFETDEDRDCLCLIHPLNLSTHEEVEDSEDLQWEDLQGKVRYKTLRVSKSLRIRDNSRPEVEEEVQELTQRLQALEADKYFMKQTIESLRRENGEMKLLQDLALQLRELGGVEQHELWPTRMPMILQFQGLMSFTRLRNNAQAHLNKLAQTCLNGTESAEHQAESSVGLSRLLQKSPERLRGTRLTRSNSWKAEKIIPSTGLSREKERWPS